MGKSAPFHVLAVFRHTTAMVNKDFLWWVPFRQSWNVCVNTDTHRGTYFQQTCWISDKHNVCHYQAWVCGRRLYAACDYNALYDLSVQIPNNWMYCYILFTFISLSSSATLKAWKVIWWTKFAMCMSELALSTTQRNQIFIFTGQSLKRVTVSKWGLILSPEIKTWLGVTMLPNYTLH
jgi:hypothetical protein